MTNATRELLPFWQRLLITILSMFAASFIIGWVWHTLFGFAMPSYVAGIVGGITALPVWEVLKRIRPKT